MNGLVSTHPTHFRKLLRSQGYQLEPVGQLLKVKGFNRYNRLIDINSIFSTNPNFPIIDRTGQISGPVRWARVRPWQVPDQTLTLEQAMQQRVQELAAGNQPINLFWSGGIDSTAVLTAMLRFLPELSQLTVIYSPWSVYEHPEYLDFLQQFTDVKLIDISGTCYLDMNQPGIWVSGNSGDEVHASVDQSFIEQYGIEQLHRPWKDFFYRRIADHGFMEFCEQFFSLSGTQICSVLEARWWFYTNCKITSILRQQTVPLLLTNHFTPVSVDNIHGFFDCAAYESFAMSNLDKILPGSFNSWKQCLKDFCHDFDALDLWYQTKTKGHSIQIIDYMLKKTVMNNKRYVAIDAQGELLGTAGLPFFSVSEFVEIYGSKIDQWLNPPDLECDS